MWIMAQQTDRRYGLPMNEVLDVLRELSVIYGIGAGYDLIDMRNGTFTVNSHRADKQDRTALP